MAHICLYHNFYSWPGLLVLARRSSGQRGMRHRLMVKFFLLQHCKIRHHKKHMTTQMLELAGCCIFPRGTKGIYLYLSVQARRSSGLRDRRGKHFVILGLLENYRSPLRTEYSRCCHCLPEKSPQDKDNICSDHLNCRMNRDCMAGMRQRTTGPFCC